jgi:hypothetical protein
MKKTQIHNLIAVIPSYFNTERILIESDLVIWLVDIFVDDARWHFPSLYFVLEIASWKDLNRIVFSNIFLESRIKSLKPLP